jgi:hypothetical protein
LQEYQGQKGERFHNSLVENVIEGCNLARKLAINPTEELLNEIYTIEALAQASLHDVEIIKGSANARVEARRKFAEASDKLSAYF